MARSLLRESQIRDVDNMSETEHDEWVHVNLVTSGTVTFTDGSVSGTGNMYAGEFHGDGSNLTGLYTQEQVDTMIATVSGALQAQIDQMLRL